MTSVALLLCAFSTGTLFANPETAVSAKAAPSPERPAAISYSDAEKAKLIDGAIVTREVSNPAGCKNGKTYEALGLIKGSLEQVFGVLADYEKYPQFMPNVDTTKIKSTEGNTAVVEYKLGLPMGQVKRYRLSLTATKEEAQAQITWHKVPWTELKDSETIVETTGYWLLKPFPEKPGHIIALYHVYTDPGHIPTGFGWIVNILTKGSMPDLVKNTNKRVGILYGK